MTIYEIKQRMENGGNAPYFFSRQTLKFFHQTLKDFHVTKNGENYEIRAYMRDNRGKVVGETKRTYSPVFNKFICP